MMRSMNQDRWTAVACLVIAVLVVLAIPSQTSDRPLPGARGFDILDGAFFPKIAVSLFIIAAIWLFIEARPRRAAGAATSDDGSTPEVRSGQGAQQDRSGLSTAGSVLISDDQPPGMTLRDLAWAVALSGGMLIYVQVLDSLGYLPCTIVGVVLLALVCGQRSPVGLFFGGVIFPAAVFYLFTRLFMVPLPRGFF
jgi:hypothetical protein